MRRPRAAWRTRPIADRARLDAARGDVKEISATPQKLQARTDWTFIFVDTTVPPLPQGEPRVRVVLSGDEPSSVGRFIFVPEDWQRRASSVNTRNVILQVATALVPSGAMITLAVLAVVAWSRRRFTPRLFLIALAQFLLVSVVTFANGWPATVANLLDLAAVSVAGRGPHRHRRCWAADRGCRAFARVRHVPGRDRECGSGCRIGSRDGWVRRPG